MRRVVVPSRWRTAWALALWGALGAAAAGCFYNPTFEDGQFSCRDDDACPEGLRCSGAPAYRCVADPSGFDGGNLDLPDGVGPEGPGGDGNDGTSSLCGDDDFEPNDRQVEALAIGPGSNLPVGIKPGAATLCPDNQDWFALNLPSQGVFVRLAPAGNESISGLTMELLDARGMSMATATPDLDGALVINNNSVARGTYFVRIAGDVPPEGIRYGLFVSWPPNDECVGAQELVAGGAPLELDLSAARNNYNPGAAATACTGRDETGVDVTFQFTLSERGRVLLRPEPLAENTSGSNLLSLMLLQGNGAATCDNIANTCIAGSAPSGTTAPGRGENPNIDQVLDAGHYYVVLSKTAPEDDDQGVLLRYAVGAECLTRQDCPTSRGGFCGYDFACVQPGAGLLEFPAAASPVTPVDLSDPVPGQAGSGIVTLPLQVAGFQAGTTVAEVQVGVAIRHTFRGDLTTILMTPPDPSNGGMPRTARLRLQNGDNSEDFHNDLVELYPVTAQPEDNLSALNGAPANGTWMLQVIDGAQQDLGRIDDFRLFIRTQ